MRGVAHFLLVVVRAFTSSIIRLLFLLLRTLDFRFVLDAYSASDVTYDEQDASGIVCGEQCLGEDPIAAGIGCLSEQTGRNFKTYTLLLAKHGQCKYFQV